MVKGSGATVVEENVGDAAPANEGAWSLRGLGGF